MATGPVPQYTSGASQFAAGAAVVFAALTAGATPRVPPMVTTAAAPQVDTRQAAGQFYTFSAASQSGGGIPSRYKFGNSAPAIYNAEAAKTRVWAALHSGSVVITDVATPQWTFGLHAAALYNAEAAKQQHWPSLVGTLAPPSQLGGFVAGAPQQFDFTLQPFYDTPTFNAQGYILPWLEAEPQSGQEIQPPSFVTAAQSAGPAKYQQPPMQSAAPQQFDFTLAAVVRSSAPGHQGPAVPSFTAGPQPLDLTIQPRVFPSVLSPQGITIPSLKTYITHPPQQDVTLAAHVWHSVRTAPVTGRYLIAAPQAADLTLPVQVRQAAVPPPVVTTALGRFVAIPPQTDTRPQPYFWPAALRGRGHLGVYAVAVPWVPPVSPTSLVWAPAAAFVPPVVSMLGRYVYAFPVVDPKLLEDPSGPYFNRPPAQRRFGWAEIIALKQTGVAGLNTIIAALSQAGVQGAKSRFLDGSSCIVVASYYDTNNVPFAPSQVAYRIDDLVSQTQILGWTGLSPAVTNQVIVTSAQNQMISLSRASEAHQVLFQIIDGYGEESFARVVFDITRMPGGPGNDGGDV